MFWVLVESEHLVCIRFLRLSSFSSLVNLNVLIHDVCSRLASPVLRVSNLTADLDLFSHQVIIVSYIVHVSDTSIVKTGVLTTVSHSSREL